MTIRNSEYSEIIYRIISIKDSITDALKEENMKLKSRVEQLEDKILRIEIAKNNHDQYTRHNNIEIQGIPGTVKDEHLENKVIDIDASDIEDCHRLGNSTPKNTIVRFVNRKFCKKALEAKFDLRKINNAELHFDTSSVLYFSENLTPYNQYLAWKCRELKRAKLIHSTWSSKGLIKIRRSMYEKPISIEHENDIFNLYPNFVFKENHRPVGKRK